MTPAFWPAIVRGVIPAVEHIEALQSLQSRTVIDVGANKGQFSLVARHLFPTAQIHAFEPLERARRSYMAVVSGPVEMHSLAMGAEKGSATFFVASREDSSSLLAPGLAQREAYGVGLSSKQIVEVARLEDVIKPKDLVSPVLCKLDVQGGELEVLRGATGLLPLIDVIYCEVSFVELYKNQPTASEVISFLHEQDFALRGIFNLSTTKKLGSTQADLLFVNAKG